METALRFDGRRALTNTRGAVFLLSVYLVSLTLLLLGGVSLNRTNIEVRSAQVSRDQQQAFWLAEAALDQAMARLKTEELPDNSATNPNYPITTTLGSASFSITTGGSQLVSAGTMRSIRQVMATGSVAGRSTQVSATLFEDKPLKGVWAKEPIQVTGLGHPLIIKGDLRTGWTASSGIKLTGWVQHQGGFQIGPSAPVLLLGVLPRPGWINPIGTNPGTDGVLLDQRATEPVTGIPFGALPTTSVTTPTVAAMQSIPAVSLPASYTSAMCSGALTVGVGQTREILDGSLNPLDLSGPNDGKIELCLAYMEAGTNAQGYPSGTLVFRAPTQVYVTGESTHPTHSYGVWLSDTYVMQPNQIVASSSSQIPDGLKIIVTKAPSPGVVGVPAGPFVSITSPRFNGSIFAPESSVQLSIQPDSLVSFQDSMGHIVAQQLYLNLSGQASQSASGVSLAGHTLDIGGNQGLGTNSTDTVTITSWNIAD